MTATTTITTRQSARLNKPLAPFPLLALPDELIDHIFSFIAPVPNRKNRLALTRLLGVCRQLVPFARRRLFKRVVLLVGDAGEKKLLPALRHVRGTTSGAGAFVRSLKVEAPLPSEARGDTPMLLIPSTSLGQVAVIRQLLDVLEHTPGIKKLAIETQVGTKDPEENNARDEDAITATREDLETALLKLDVTGFSVAVPSATQALQALSSSVGSGWNSPFISPFVAWSNLTSLELWRVHLDISPLSEHTPSFRLRELSIISSEFAAAKDLEWLLGPAGGPRSANLTTLRIRELDFSDSPTSSNPLTAIFPTDGTIPSFATTLTTLELSISHPFSNASHLLSPLLALRDLELGGPGITLSLFASHLPLPPSSPSSPSPSLHLPKLTLTYTPLLPQSALISLLTPSSHNFPALRTLDIGTHISHPRSWSWQRVRETPLRSWEWDEEDEWTKLRKVARGGGWEVRRNGVMQEVYESGEEEESEDEEAGEGSEDDGLFEPSEEAEGEPEWRREEEEEESD